MSVGCSACPSFGPWTTVCEVFASARWPLGALGVREAAVIKDQTRCFPSFTNQGAGATTTTCAAITHSALVAPWETLKKVECNRKTILVSIFPWQGPRPRRPYLVVSVRLSHARVILCPKYRRLQSFFQNGCCTLWRCMQTNGSLVVTGQPPSLLTC